MTHAKLLAALLAVMLAGCSSIPGAPSCDKVRYERDGKEFKFYCEGHAGIILGSPL